MNGGTTADSFELESTRMRLLVFLLLGLASCAGDPAEFRPAKNAASYPPVRNAYRLPQVPTECEKLGAVLAEGSETTIEDVAITAARHGGTHYVVGQDRSEITGYTGVAIYGVTSLTPDKHRTIWAQVYRCPS